MANSVSVADGDSDTMACGRSSSAAASVVVVSPPLPGVAVAQVTEVKLGAKVTGYGSEADTDPLPMAIGATSLKGTGVSLVAVAAVFSSDVPKGLSSAAGMRKAGRGAG